MFKVAVFPRRPISAPAPSAPGGWVLRSLQGRLTAGVMLALLAGLMGLAVWSGWHAHRLLLDNHKERASLIAQRFAEDVALYEEMMPLPQALQEAINYRTTADTALWVKSEAGEVLAVSDTLEMGSWQASGVAEQLLDLRLTSTLEIRPVQDWRLVICAAPLTVNDRPVGMLYVADDATADQASFRQMTVNLLVFSTLVVGLLAVGLSLYIRRALRPLRRLNHLASTVTADTLCEHQLRLETAPTEVQQLASSYNLMLERLAKAWSQQKRFVNDVSHELRTPLTLVQGYLQSTLRRCQTLTDPQREGLEIAAAEAERTVQLLQELLELARIDSGQMPFNLQRHDLQEVVLAATTAATAQGISIKTELTGPVLVRCDRNRLQEALLQLIDNAVKYSPPNSPVWVRLTQQPDWASIAVEDHGCGIPLTQQGDIFEPFYRVDENRSRTTGGTGLGLTVVRALVEAMQGQVTVRSTPSGSTFTICLPA